VITNSLNPLSAHLRGRKTPKFVDSHYITQEHSSKHAFLLHTHPDKVELYFVLRGSTRYMVGDRFYNIEEGDIVICDQGVMHGESFMDVHDDSSISVGICDLYLEDLSENCFCEEHTKPIVHTHLLSGQVRSIFQLIYTLSADIKNTRGICDSLTASLVLIVAEFLKSRKKMRLQEVEENGTYFIARGLRHKIDEDFHRDVAMKSIAEQMHISESYASHAFKDWYGISPKQYLTERRLGEAQRLLQLTKLSVNEIGEKVGFSSASHFITIFAKYIGLSPAKYRQSLVEMDSMEEQER
jgi:AraC-like DNA-binding protein